MTIAQDGRHARAILSPCGKYRYRLERSCSASAEEKKVIAFFGINPSTADASVDDPTVGKLIEFTNRNGGTGFIIGNAFAYRSAEVKDLRHDPLVQDDINWEHVRQIIADADVLVACWGNRSKVPRTKRQTIDMLAEILFSSGKPVLHFGVTVKGDPKHPGRIAYETQLIPWII